MNPLAGLRRARHYAKALKARRARLSAALYAEYKSLMAQLEQNYIHAPTHREALLILQHIWAAKIANGDLVHP